MARRVCMGQRNAGQFGLWISKPGHDVLTASYYNMLFASDEKAVQVLTTGALTWSRNMKSAAIYFPNFGYRPTILWNVTVPGWENAAYKDILFDVSQSQYGDYAPDTIIYSGNTAATFTSFYPWNKDASLLLTWYALSQEAL